MNEIVEEWIKRNNRKGAKLVSQTETALPTHLRETTARQTYKIVYRHRGKVRLGIVKDKMYVRYGIFCIASMLNTSVTSLWQVAGGAITEEDIKVMQDYLVGVCELPTFDFGSLSGLDP